MTTKPQEDETAIGWYCRFDVFTYCVTPDKRKKCPKDFKNCAGYRLPSLLEKGKEG